MARSPYATQVNLRFSAIRRASSRISEVAPAPAISRASGSTCSDKAGLKRTGRLSPWRRAFLAEWALPGAVFGPVLARAFARFAFVLPTLIMRHR
jgi:hypothetical protein